MLIKGIGGGMFCSSCGTELRDGDVYCPKCGSKIETVSQEKESIYNHILRQQINDVKKEEGSPTGNELPAEIEVPKEETNANMSKRTPADWWDGWICSNCGKKNNINQKTCLGCRLDIRSSIALGRRSGAISQEEEQFYYERILPQQMQMELLQKQNDEFMREKAVRMSQEDSYRQANERQETVSGFAICSLIVGILSLLLPFVFSWSIFNPLGDKNYFKFGLLAALGLMAVLFSISPIKKNKVGKGMAIAGLILGIIAFTYWGITFIRASQARDMLKGPDNTLIQSRDKMNDNTDGSIDDVNYIDDFVDLCQDYN